MAGVSPSPIKYLGFSHTISFIVFKSPASINLLKTISSCVVSALKLLDCSGTVVVVVELLQEDCLDPVIA